jgi:2-polyprenyl-3-methyl-5-hydroxy-6-metoxy-1,4-benzoquinol methylase
MSHRKRYSSKQEWILPFVTGKRVLDLGCVDHNLNRSQRSSWLHALIVQQASFVLGVDYLEKEVLALQHRGFNVVVANVETMDLAQTFDVIVAGDIIEHLSNPGMFLERVSQHLNPDGIFIVTTPNPVHILRFVSLLVFGEVKDNKEHTCYFTPQVLRELARRYGFAINEVAYIDDSYQYHRKRIWYLWPVLLSNYVLNLFLPQFSQTYGYVLKAEQSGPVKNGDVPHD